jgi:hypothetical protein
MCLRKKPPILRTARNRGSTRDAGNEPPGLRKEFPFFGGSREVNHLTANLFTRSVLDLMWRQRHVFAGFPRRISRPRMQACRTSHPAHRTSHIAPDGSNARRKIVARLSLLTIDPESLSGVRVATSEKM